MPNNTNINAHNLPSSLNGQTQNPQMYSNRHPNILPSINPQDISNHLNGHHQNQQTAASNTEAALQTHDPMLLQQQTETQPPKSTKKLSDLDRQRIVEILIQDLSSKGQPSRGMIQKTASQFKVSRRTIGSLWKLAKEQLQNGQAINVKSRMPGRVGRKKIELNLSKITDIPLHRRTNIRSLAKALGVPKSTTHRLVQEGKIKSHSNAIKPYLTSDNVKKRLAFCLSKLQPTNTISDPCFEDMYNYIHIDEKWFFMTKTSQKFYLHPTEQEPQRTCKSKRFITKVMFLAAVARPRFGEGGQTLFDGKIGIFPFTVIETAKRNSKNRAAGVLECKPINSITKEVIKACLIEKMIPAIKNKWPNNEKRVIFIQQDNAKPHLDPNDADFIQASTSTGFDIRLICQPSNSPDLNVLDLGFFRAIQSLQYESAPKTVVDLVNVVTNAYNELEASTLNKVWLSLQYCMNEILKVKGTNEYKLPHVGKNRMEKEGTLPKQVTVDASTIHDAILFMNEGDLQTTTDM